MVRRGRGDLDHHSDASGRHPRRRIKEQVELCGRQGYVWDDPALPLDDRDNQSFLPGEIHWRSAGGKNLLDDPHNATFMVAIGGWRHDYLSVNQLGSIALGGIEGEKVLKCEIRLSVWFTTH